MPEITLHYWLPNGVGLSVKSEADSLDDLLSISARYLSMGLLTAQPTNEGLERELIVTVMRREKSDGTPIIDFYPVWGFGTDEPFGTYKTVRKYLNNDGDIDQFLNASGFNSLKDIPLYDGQAPLKRSAGKKHPKETDTPKPFIVVRKQGKEKTNSEGGAYREWELVGYEISAQGSNQNASQSRQDSPNSSATGETAQSQPDTLCGASPERIGKFLFWAQSKLQISHGQSLEALQYFSFNKVASVDQYEGTTHQAMAACIAYVCQYDIASIATATFADGSEIASGISALAIEMIELNAVPF